MNVKTILEQKGGEVLTLGPEDSIADAVRMLADRRIGALVVTDDAGAIAGILSERDVVRCLASHGAEALNQKVRGVMTPEVSTCNEQHTVNDVMEMMTAGRFRHVPVVRDGTLVGIVSIGDVVKRRIEEAEREAEEIKQYIATA